MADTHIKFDKPKRGLPDGGGVLCRHCGRELEAVGESSIGISVSGIRWYSWRHVRTQTIRCVVEFEGEPYDDWDATQKIETAERASQSKAGRNQ
jgi:hypothetical protein